MTNDTIFHCCTWFITGNTIKTNPIIPVQRKKNVNSLMGSICVTVTHGNPCCTAVKNGVTCHSNHAKLCWHVPFPQEQNKRLENEGHKNPDRLPQGCAAANISQAEDSENWTDGSGQEPPLFPLQGWHSWHCYRSCCCLYHPVKTKTKCTYWWLYGQAAWQWACCRSWTTSTWDGRGACGKRHCDRKTRIAKG